MNPSDNYPKLYTFIVDFRGGTYCTQVYASNLDDSLLKWIDRLKIEKTGIKFLGNKTIEQLEEKIIDPDYKPVSIAGLINAWCTSCSTRKGFFLINIILTEK